MGVVVGVSAGSGVLSSNVAVGTRTVEVSRREVVSVGGGVGVLVEGAWPQRDTERVLVTVGVGLGVRWEPFKRVVMFEHPLATSDAIKRAMAVRY